MKYMVETFKMFEFGSCDENESDHDKKDEEGHAFLRRRLVARDFKNRHECPRDDLHAAMIACT